MPQRLTSYILAAATIATTAYAQDASSIKNRQDVIDAAAKSSCASHSWNHGHQGVAPSGYTKGVALTFAKSFCELKKAAPGPTSVMSGPLGAEAKDALAEYNQHGTKMPTTSALERLESNYGLLLGLGMVESSGRTTISAPFDSANPHPTADTAEAGLYQTSANSLSSDPSLPKLLQYYTGHDELCEFDLFTDSKHPKITPPIGKLGPDTDFQQLTKSCPSFATESAAVMIRVNRHHYGTLNIRSAEYSPSCVPMFKHIESVVDCGT